MADEIKEFSRDEASGFIFYGGPAQGSMSPAQQAPAAGPVAPPKLSMPSKGKPVARIPDPTQLVETVGKANKDLQKNMAPPEPPSAIGGLVDQITNNWKPLAIGAGAVYAVTRGPSDVRRVAQYGKSKIENFRKQTQALDIERVEALDIERVDPTFASDVEMRQAEIASQKPSPSMTPLEDLQKRRDDLTNAVQSQRPPVQAPEASWQSMANGQQQNFDPARIGQPLRDPLAGRDYQTPAQEMGPRQPVEPPTASPKPNSTVTQTVQRTLAGELSNMSPAGRSAAELFAEQYPNHAADLAKEGKFGLLGGGSADNNLFNAYGPDLRKQILNELNDGNLGGVYDNYKNRIAPALKALPPDSALAKQLEDLRVNDPKGANRGQLGTTAAVMPDKLVQGSGASKLLKPGLLDKAGKAALVMMLADSANAASKGDYAGAAKTAISAVDPTGAATAAFQPEQTAQSLSQVSPIFGILSQLFNASTKEKQYAEKVGAGRGIAPPSAYQR